MEGLLALDELPACVFSDNNSIDHSTHQSDDERSDLDDVHNLYEHLDQANEVYVQYATCAVYDALPLLAAMRGVTITSHTTHSPGRSPSKLNKHTRRLSPLQLTLLCRDETLITALQLSSHLARNSEKYYPMLCAVFNAPKLVYVLTQRNKVVRAKCCNLIGNLCR